MDNIKKIKIEHFRNLVAVAIADGYWHQNEKQLITKKAKEFGIKEEDALEIIENAKDLMFMVPQNIVDREEQLSDAVHMALVDGELHHKEYELCVNIANRLGFSQRSVDQAIEMIRGK